MLSLIVATGKNGEIGLNGTMPWHLPEDLAYFKEVTKGNPMIMGRKTFQSLPGVLPGRKHIVITKDPGFKPGHPQVEVLHSLEEALDRYRDSQDNAFIIGGANIYSQAINHCHKLYITLIHEEFCADTYFPEFNREDYKIISTSEILKSSKTGLKYQFTVYEK